MEFTLKSRTVAGHLLRGLAGLVFFVIFLSYAESWGWWAAIPGLAALGCFRGCPMCWTVGLIETIIDGGSGACTDGSCVPRDD